MLGALIIVFREVLEAGLIVGIVMAATRGVIGRDRWIVMGMSAGVLGAAVVAMFAGMISEAFQGSGQELFNASVLGAAVVMLMWHNAWMARHGRQLGIMVRQVEDEIGVINMAIGAAHTGCRAMCATSGGGFALMTEGLGAAAMALADCQPSGSARVRPVTSKTTEPGWLSRRPERSPLRTKSTLWNVWPTPRTTWGRTRPASRSAVAKTLTV